MTTEERFIEIRNGVLRRHIEVTTWQRELERLVFLASLDALRKIRPHLPKSCQT